MNTKIKMKPKPLKRTNVKNRFELTPSSKSDITKKVLWNVKCKRLVQLLQRYGADALDYERLTILSEALQKIVDDKIKQGIIKK